MSFRYKSAVLSLGSLVIIYGGYFVNLMVGMSPGHDQVQKLGGTVLLVALVQVIGHIVIAKTSQDRYAAMDERERSFDRRATNMGYYLMIVGTLAAGATLHFGARPSDMANAILLAIVVAESARQAMFIALHHRVG